MRNVLAVVLCLGLFAAVANAQGSVLHLYFSETGAGDVIPPEWAAQTVPVLPPGPGSAYLWAFVITDDLWNGLALENHGSNATGGQMYNDPIPVLGNIRWEPPPGSDLDPTPDNYIFGFSVQQMGLGDSNEATGDAYFGWDYFVPGTGGGHYLVAEYDFDGSADVFLAPGAGGISLSGAGPGDNSVYMGFGDGPVADNAVGETTELADLIFIPEPASMLLLGLVGLFLRRR